MATTVKLSKLLHRKAAEYCSPCPGGNTTAGCFFAADKSGIYPTHDNVVLVLSASSIWNYNADQDSWLQLPNSGIAGTFGAGSCGCVKTVSAPAGNTIITATAGTTTTLSTSLTITQCVAGTPVRVIGGTGVGYSGSISECRIGTNTILTVTPANGVAFDNTTQFQILGGSLWFFNAGAGAVGFSVYDKITNTWAARSVTGLPTTFGTQGQLVATDGYGSNDGAGLLNSTATGGATATLSDTTKTWPSNGWANSQVRIISGTGAGQIRTISSNTPTVLTVSSNWTVVPDATSVYRIEGNDDYLYLFGNNAVTLYRYSVSGNSWTTLSPSVARAAALATGGTASWVDSSTYSTWTDGTYGNHYSTTIIRQIGRYIYSFRGGATSTLDVYDLAANTWINGVVYGQQNETLSTGSCSVGSGTTQFVQKDATGRIYIFDVAQNKFNACTFNPVPQGTVVVGDKMFLQTYVDGTTRLTYLYTMGNTRSELTRWLIVP